MPRVDTLPEHGENDLTDTDQFYLEDDPTNTKQDQRVTWLSIATHFGRSHISVAATNAYSRTKRGSDLRCDGTADQDQINTALADLPNGGTVLLSEGQFIIDR